VQQSPGDGNRHTLGSGVFIPGLFNRKRRLSEADDSELRMGEDGGVQARVAPGGPMEVMEDGGTTDFVALAAKVDLNFTTLLTLLKTWSVTPADGGLALQTAALLLSTPGVGAAKLKAE